MKLPIFGYVNCNIKKFPLLEDLVFNKGRREIPKLN